MTLPPRPMHNRPIDWERVFIVPILVLTLIAVVASLAQGQHAPDLSSPMGWLRGGYLILLVAFYLLAIGLMLFRPPAAAKSAGPWPRVAAYGGSFLPMLIPLLGAADAAPWLSAIAVVLQFLGLAFTVWALWSLGLSFGLAPQARTLVDRGPYRFVRHPLYVGEALVLLGAVLFAPSWSKAALLVLILAIQVARAGYEESLLAATFAGYPDYQVRTARFIPGLY